MITLAYTGNGLDRCANRRGDVAWLAEQRAAANVRMIHINGDKTIFADGRLVTEVPSSIVDTVFLGIDDQCAAWFTCRSDHTENLRDLRSLALEDLLPHHELGVLAQARALIHWHERHRFCSNCGAKNEIADGGHRCHCPSCGANHFPRTGSRRHYRAAA